MLPRLDISLHMQILFFDSPFHERRFSELGRHVRIAADEDSFFQKIFRDERNEGLDASFMPRPGRGRITEGDVQEKILILFCERLEHVCPKEILFGSNSVDQVDALLECWKQSQKLRSVRNDARAGADHEDVFFEFWVEDEATERPLHARRHSRF